MVETRSSASQVWCWDWLLCKRADFILFLPRSNSFPSSPSFSLRVSLPGDQCQLHVATAARLVLLSLDVVVYLELGLILLLGGSVLQLPEEETRRKLDTEEVDVWDGAHRVSKSRKGERKRNTKSTSEGEKLISVLRFNQNAFGKNHLIKLSLKIHTTIANHPLYSISQLWGHAVQSVFFC